MSIEAEVIEREEQIPALVEVTKGEVRALKIVDDTSLQDAVTLGGKIKTRGRLIEAWFKPLVDAAYTAWKKLVKARDEALKPFQDSEAEIKRAAIAYTSEKERLRREEQKRLDDAAKAKQKADADAAGAFDGPEAAAAVMATPPAVVAPPAVEKPKGAGMGRNYLYEVVDPALVPRAYLMIDEKKLAQFAKAMKGEGVVPGVRFWDEPSMSLRAS